MTDPNRVRSRRPDVTVLLPVFNGERFLREAISSVLEQTFRNLELIVINDGSTDSTEAVVTEVRDERLVYRKNSTNLGMVATLNLGLELATGRFIARMDADDVCHPNRLQRQVDFLVRHPEVGLLGTAVEFIGHTSETCYVECHPSRIRSSLLFYNPIYHPTVMMRSSVIQDFSLRYDPSFLHAEDYDLWERMTDVTSAANIPRPLLYYRLHDTQASSVYREDQARFAGKIHARLLQRLGIDTTPTLIDLHTKLYWRTIPRDMAFFDSVEDYLRYLDQANHKTRIFDRAAFRATLGGLWLSVCESLAQQGANVRHRFVQSPISRWYWPGSTRLLKFLFRGHKHLLNR